MSIDYLAIARRVQTEAEAQSGCEKSEKSPLQMDKRDVELNSAREKSEKSEKSHGRDAELNSAGEISEKSEISHWRDLMPQLWPIPAAPNISAEMRAWLDDGTLARFSRERTFNYTPASECIDLPRFARALLERIGTEHEGPHTWQRLELAYWTVRSWLEEKSAVRF